MADEKFSFRWGIPWLDEGHTTIPNFIFRHYIEVGVTRSEFLAILHLASYKYESSGGKASPSLEKLATDEMGYSASEGLRKLVRSLEAKGMLTRHLRTGDTSIYDFGGFSRKVLAAYLNSQEGRTLQLELETPPTEVGDPLQLELEQRTKEEQHQQSDDGGYEELVKHLAALGVHEGQAQKWAAVRSPEMITGWIEYIRQHGQSIHDVPAFLVAKLRDGENPPAMERPEDDRKRYIDGPYAHLIQH